MQTCLFITRCLNVAEPLREEQIPLILPGQTGASPLAPTVLSLAGSGISDTQVWPTHAANKSRILGNSFSKNKSLPHLGRFPLCVGSDRIGTS